jgi:non-homologous end joining protein Ku
MGGTPRKLKPPDDEDQVTTIQSTKIYVRELSNMLKRPAQSPDPRELRLALELIRRAAREFDAEKLTSDLARAAVAF